MHKSNHLHEKCMRREAYMILKIQTHQKYELTVTYAYVLILD